MKKVIIITAIILLNLEGYGQLFTFSFGSTVTSTCVTDGNSVTIPNAAEIHFSRTSLTCESGNFNNSNWTVSATSPTDLSTLTKYIEVTITPNSGYQVSLSLVNFFAQKSSTGPTTAWVSHNLSGNFNDNKKDFTPATSAITTTANQVTWDFTDFTSTSAIKFRIYAWGLNSAGGGTATTAGTFRIDKFSLSGAITPIGGNSGNNFTPFTFDLTNNLAGLGKTPTQTLDVIGNIRTTGKLLVGNIDDTKVTALTDYSLAVNGTAIFKKALVKNYTAWPDFVFEEKYGLRSLAEVEKYIKRNKHLPDVPAEKEINKEGIDLGTNQAILLQKIEELTLYAIAQNKKMEVQQQQIKKMQQQIKRLTRPVAKK